jgi:hypothetical protein
MSRIENFSKFTSEGLASTGSKMRRIVTGESAGDEIEKLSNEQQQKLVDLYIENPMEAAKYLRSIIIKEKNSQFGLGLALTLAGAAMIYKAMDVDPPKPPKPPEIDFHEVAVKDGDGLEQALNKVAPGPKLTPESPIEDLLTKIKWLGKGDPELGIENVTKGIVNPTDRAEMVGALKSLFANPHEHGNTLAEIMQGNMSGTGKNIGDLMDWAAGTKIWVPNK